MKRSNFKAHGNRFCCYLFLLPLAFRLRVHRLDFQSLWEDEIHSVVRVKASLSAAINDIP